MQSHHLTLGRPTPAARKDGILRRVAEQALGEPVFLLRHHDAWEEIAMGIEQAPTEKGRQAARGLEEATSKEEQKVEAQKGSDLAKGADRFEERAKSSDGKSSGSKQI
jgi:hypothetical protein